MSGTASSPACATAAAAVPRPGLPPEAAATTDAPGAPALVVFSGDTDIRWLRLLRPGFRHCFAVVRTDGAWVVVDPLSHYTALRVVPELAGWDPARWFRARGLTVLPARIREPARRLAPWRPYTCVEAVKRVIGVRLPGVFTPWQLYRALGGTKTKCVFEENILDTTPEYGA
ncbi:hypothetical protein C882_1980 [Caenispirillum salinarum AK4]|uniref:Uncharacterized protein n=1 Tax=Caenispirillum salinarum AK4 TaxID=1238182 RepID=K9HEE5_9PROT|nr:hypothetical protein [Caenispirillum salinarum]EKV27051.1 hypothetical protein C882_1980 [Caenispirillum salinarum AK4]